MIGLGVSGLVELSEEGYAIKSPWPPGSEDSLSDMRFEAKVYNHLGSHPRLIKVIDWDAEECCLAMENMSNGTLKDYLEKNNAFPNRNVGDGSCKQWSDSRISIRKVSSTTTSNRRIFSSTRTWRRRSLILDVRRSMGRDPLAELV